MLQFRNLVFEGGGVKRIAYVGAMKVLEQKLILKDIKRLGGTSAGTIYAVLVACRAQKLNPNHFPASPVYVTMPAGPI